MNKNFTLNVKRPLLETLVKHSAVTSWFTRVSRVFEFRCPSNVTHVGQEKCRMQAEARVFLSLL